MASKQINLWNTICLSHLSRHCIALHIVQENSKTTNVFVEVGKINCLFFHPDYVNYPNPKYLLSIYISMLCKVRYAFSLFLLWLNPTSQEPLCLIILLKSLVISKVWKSILVILLWTLEILCAKVYFGKISASLTEDYFSQDWMTSFERGWSLLNVIA